MLTVSASYSDKMKQKDMVDVVNDMIAAHGDTSLELVSGPTLSADGSEVCVELRRNLETTFLQLIRISSIPVSATSCSAIGEMTSAEIALVLDVSSSMIEEGRFAPMQDAAREFVEAFSSNSKLSDQVKLAIVPFSSRVNIGMTHTDWLMSYAGSPAVPSRWTNPNASYSSSYSKGWWIDGKTPVMYNSKNYYWMGCIEPRADIEMKDTGSTGSYGLTDDNPKGRPFVAMDTNPGSSQSFCPPPITPLSGDFNGLENAISELTSQGSTRLDAGLVAAWYTLSPKWKGMWKDSSTPRSYSSKDRKIAVFMTDGEMNTQYGKSAGKLDWLCYYMQSTSKSDACNNKADQDMLTICSDMKDKGIEIYAVAYGEDADQDTLRACASDDDHFYSASAASSSADYIPDVYKKIAAKIRNESVRLTR